jgi:extracellular solute-binding protein (family 5)
MSRDGIRRRTRTRRRGSVRAVDGRRALDRRVAHAALIISLSLVAIGCGKSGSAPVSATWVVGEEQPAFDPQGPPDPVRAALLRLLSQGLVEEDSSGRIVPAAAESVGVTSDGLVYTFHLRPDLRFPDGSPCGSAAFRRALEQGLDRLDHGTFAWLLASVVGMERLRPGRPLPSLGIATPDERTLVLRLARPDSLLLRKLALPGAATPFADGAPEQWRGGVGAYRVSESRPGWLTLVRRRRQPPEPDTLQIRFVTGAARSRALLRAGVPDLVWPLPPGLLDQPLPAGYRDGAAPARPPRLLLLVLRPDYPPTSGPAARHALAHALHRSEILAELGIRGEEVIEWLAGAGPFAFPARDDEQVRAWLERGNLGRSLHVVMAYSADGVAAEVARPMQIEWAGLGLDVELRALRGAPLAAELLRRGGAHALLVETQPLFDHPLAELATLVAPLRGPPVGSFRSGWTTREFDAWLSPGAPRSDLSASAVQARLAEERIAIPLARLPWTWAQRENAAALRVHPRYGPDITALRSRSSPGNDGS